MVRTKLQTAIDLTEALNTIVALFKAGLAEAEEWTREDEKFAGLAGVQRVVRLHGEKLEAEFHRYHRAQAMVNLVFPSSFVDQSGVQPLGTELNVALGEFEEDRGELVKRLQELMPDTHFQDLAAQRSRGEFEPGVHDELASWMAEYKRGSELLRAKLPRLRTLTEAAENDARAMMRSLRHQLEPYSI